MTTLALLPDPSEPLEHETAEAAFADILDGKVPDEAIARIPDRDDDCAARPASRSPTPRAHYAPA